MSQPRDPGQGRYYPQRPPLQYQQPQRYQPPVAYAPPRAPEPVRRPRRIPGVGLILTLVGLVIQVLSLFVLPWVSAGASAPNLLDLRHASISLGTHGFGAWYLVLFSYPLAALGIVLALAAVLDSAVLKVIWACLALAGVGVLVLSYGLLPVVQGVHFTTQKITTAVIALAASAVVIFVLKSALSMFRRVAGLILLVLAGVHVAAVIDLVKGSGIENLGIGAYGPAVSYVLIAIAAFTAPRRVPGV